MTRADRGPVAPLAAAAYPGAMQRPRIAVVAGEPGLEEAARRWLSQAYSIVPVARGRYFAADLTAAAADLILVEAVHPSEAGWLLAWLKAQPPLAATPVLMVVPRGPAPCARRRGVVVASRPIHRPTLLAHVDKLLRASKNKSS